MVTGEASEARESVFALLKTGAVAQLGERVLCKHEVIGSIPFSSTITCEAGGSLFARMAGGSLFALMSV